MAEPSIAMIPSGYKAEKIYSVLPTNGNADLDFARNSKATRINEQGLIEEMAVNVPLLDYSDGTCPSLLLQPQSTNLITYSEAFSNSYWTKSGASIEGDASTAGVEKVVNGDFENGSNGWSGNGWTFNQGSVSIVSANGAYSDSAIHQSTLTSGLNYEIKVTVESINGSGLFVWNSSSVGGGINITEVGTYSFNSISNGNRINILAQNGASVTITNVSIKEVQGFSAPSVDSPLGAFKATKLGNSSNDRIKTDLTITSGVSYSVSVFLKNDTITGTTTIASRVTGGTLFRLGFDWNGETPSISASHSSGTRTNEIIENYGNGWYRLGFSFLSDGTDLDVEVDLDRTNATDTTSLFIWGAQLEQQSYATSYIPTEGSTQTRLQDSASKSGISSLINSSEGVLYAEISALYDNSVNDLRWFSLNDNSTNNLVTIYYYKATNTIGAQLKVGGVQVFRNDDIPITSKTDFIKIAFKWKQDDVAIYINGIKKASSTSVNSFNSGVLNRFSFDRGVIGQDFYGNIKAVAVLPILTDEELECLTTR